MYQTGVTGAFRDAFQLVWNTNGTQNRRVRIDAFESTRSVRKETKLVRTRS